MAGMSLQFKVDPKDMEILEALPEILRPETLRKAQWTLMDLIRVQIKRNAQGGVLKRRSGALGESWTAEAKIESDGSVTGSVFSASPYAAIHEYGGVILPVNGQFLVWEAKGGLLRDVRGRLTGGRKSNLIFAKRVVMPAREYVSKAVEEIAPQAAQVVEDVIMDEIKEFWGSQD